MILTMILPAHIPQFNGRSVQPFEATISDGTTHIRATFDCVATDLFTKMNSRDFLDVLGGVIGLVDFNIVSFVSLSLHVLCMS
jgi:hypothetical protein